jgi:DNA-binding MarR family transcriptional regulator
MRKHQTSSTGRVPAPGEGKRGEEGYLGYLLRQAANLYQNRLARVLADLDVTPPQFAVMTMIGAYPGVSNADIARLALLTPQTVSVIIANLERAGSVSRRPHEVHGRIKHLELTDSGRVLLGAARKRVHSVEKELADGFTEHEQRALRRWLAGVAKRMTEA